MSTNIDPNSDGMKLIRRLTLAYWPRPELNESANQAAGDTAVDALTLADLRLFFDTIKTGPTYVMVRHRFLEPLKALFADQVNEAAQEAKNTAIRFAAETARILSGLID